MSEDNSQQVVPSKWEPPLSRIGLNSHKAGMEGLDKDKINDIILEASKGSKYYQNELRKDQEINKKVIHMLDSLKKVTPAQKEAAAKAVDKRIQELELSRDLSRIIVHVDMDAFYAAVEMRDDPTLKDRPMAVGSSSMLSTSNYAARRYGVRAAMPGFIARKLCPTLVIVNPNYDKYHKASKDVQEVLSEYDPNFCSVGLDESYLDITDFVMKEVEGRTKAKESGWSPDDCNSSTLQLYKSHYTCAEQVVFNIRESILKATGLTASAGIAPNKLLAKIASDMNKPNGQCMVKSTREDILKFLKELPIRKISGIGRVTEKMLNALNITLCCHLYEKRNVLHLLFSKTSMDFFLASCLGLGSVKVQRFGDRKSMSTERSFTPTSDPVELMARCQELCQILAGDMKKENIKGRTITVKMKTADFEIKSRGVTMSRLLSESGEVYQVASDLLKQEIGDCSQNPLKLRLIGVRVSALQCAENGQETLKAFLAPIDVISDSTTDVLSSSVDHGTGPEVKSLSKATSRCPICGVEVPTSNLLMNQHIDECLNKPAIKSMIKTSPNHELAESVNQKEPCKRAQTTLTAYFAESPKKTKLRME